MIPGARMSYDLEINDRNGKTKARSQVDFGRKSCQPEEIAMGSSIVVSGSSSDHRRTRRPQQRRRWQRPSRQCNRHA